MNDTDRNPADRTWIQPEPLTIRMATPDDARALIRLAQLDSSPPPSGGSTLIAEVAGEPRAALPLDGGPPIANPFRPTAPIVALLEERRLELRCGPARRARLARWRPRRFLRPAPRPTI